MGNNMQQLYSGLHLMYIGDLITIIGLTAGLLILFIPGFIVLAILILLAGLVGAIMSVVGLARLRGEHPDYMNALVLFILAFACNMVSKYVPGPFANGAELAGSICSLAQAYFLIRGTNSLLCQIGREELAAKGRRVFVIQVAGTVLSMLLSVLTVIFSQELGMLVVLMIVSLLIATIISVFSLLYLKESSEAFQNAA